MPNPSDAIQAVLFDYGQVLSAPPDPDAWERLRAALDVEEKPLHEAYWRFRDHYDRGILNAPTYWAAVASALDRQMTVDLLRKLIDADTALWSRPNPDMIAWAAELQRAGIKTGILSNIGDAMESGLLDTLPWLHHFTHHTFSHREGIAKPDALIYRYAAVGLATEPQHILFIDDRADNIAAARAAGMKAIQYTTHTVFVQSMQAAGFGPLLNPAAPPQ